MENNSPSPKTSKVAGNKRLKKVKDLRKQSTQGFEETIAIGSPKSANQLGASSRTESENSESSDKEDSKSKHDKANDELIIKNLESSAPQGQTYINEDFEKYVDYDSPNEEGQIEEINSKAQRYFSQEQEVVHQVDNTSNKNDRLEQEERMRVANRQNNLNALERIPALSEPRSVKSSQTKELVISKKSYNYSVNDSSQSEVATEVLGKSSFLGTSMLNKMSQSSQERQDNQSTMGLYSK